MTNKSGDTLKSKHSKQENPSPITIKAIGNELQKSFINTTHIASKHLSGQEDESYLSTVKNGAPPNEDDHPSKT